MERNKKYKKIITMLLILLFISLVALTGTEIYKHLTSKESASVSVPENFIIPEDDGNNTGTDNSGSSNEDNIITDSTGSNGSSNDSGSSKPASTVISLHKGHFTDNQPFKVINMLPGDSEVKNYCLKVSYKNPGTIKFLVDIHNQHKKLLEVLKLKVVLLNSGDVLYDGLMRDMGELQTFTLKKSNTEKTEELYYEISAYLDTSVGNEYMGPSRELKANFKWWVDENA